jgi:uncharacterized surface anchored protein
MTAFHFRRRKTRRLWMMGSTTALLTIAVLILVASAAAVLPGSPSSFESGNDPTLGLGNMIVDTTGDSDWKTVATTATDTPYVHLTDLASSNLDDSFTPGSKQDTPCPTVEGHGNPPKDDFTDVASYTEVASGGAHDGETYLYGATIRYTANGNASENIELKQSSELCPGSAKLTIRSDGDKLIAIDYLGGGKAVQFHVLTFTATEACFVSKDTAPCWGADVQTLSANSAEGGVNTSAITAANNPINGKALVAGQFAEFGINLALANIIPTGSCKGFSQTVWESRSSGSSFVSSTKDIAIEDKDINNCSSVSVRKVGSDGGSQEGAVFTLYNGTGTGGTVVGTCTVDANGDCVDANGDNPFVDLNPGDYTLDETGQPAGYGKDPDLPYSFTLAQGDSPALEFTDPALLGAIEITKTSSKGLNPGLEGASFDITAPDASVTSVTTGADGTVCVDGLSFGTYSVQETAAPTGYGIDDTTAHDVIVNATSTCGDGFEATFAATDTPLTDLVVTATGEAAPAGTTKSQITCVDSSDANIGDSPTANTDPATMTANGLEPGTYTCTVVIDP